ncbi:MAG: hypothetical protein WDN24_04785 [Sphingomonas sp.]
MKLPKLTLTDARRKFVREVGSVVLGVLIALAIGELADAARWKWRVNNSLQAVAVELGGARVNLEERIALQPCMERRIAQIGAILKQARRTHSLPDVKAIGAPSSQLVVNSAFQVAQSDGVFLHMDLERARWLASIYTLVTTAYLNLTEQEHQSWRTLRLLENSPGEVDSDLLASLLQAWSDARELGGSIGGVAEQGARSLREAGIAVPERYRTGRRGADERRGAAVCATLIVDGKPTSAGP